MDLKSTQLKDTYGNLLTIGTTAGSPTSGTLQNGDGEDITSLTIAGTTDATLKIDSNRSDIILSEGDTTDENTLIRQQSSLFRIDTVADDLTTATRRFTLDHSSGDISFRDSSTNEAFYWDASTARLGLGTQTPSANGLTIEKTGNHLFLRATTASAGKYWNFDVTSGNQLYIVNNDSSGFLTITDSGNVGINGTSANKKLYVLGDTTNYQILAEQPSGYAGLSIKSTTVAQTWSWIAQDNSSNSDLLLYGGASAGTKLTIDSSGNVGIGTDSPSEKLAVQSTFTTSASDVFLEINSGHQASGGSDVTGEAGILFKQGGSGDVLRSAGAIISGREGNYSTNSVADSYLAFETAVNGTNTEAMRIDSGGDTTHIASYGGGTSPFRVGYGTYDSFTPTFLIDDTGAVGIGETNPATDLDVNGTTQSGDFRSFETTISIPTATATTVLDLTGAGLNDRKAGWIFVRDNSGTRTGSFGQFMHLSDSGVGSSWLFNIQNGFSGSSLTLSGDEIKFEHAVGSTRTYRITVMYMNDGN